ncbi:hypothetical protein Y032_0433g1382 [Ancylostoma ceylanicum]|nr:hypothetical protein Y032_0433g1382 [Ancylostoma ceylanicum]
MQFKRQQLSTACEEKPLLLEGRRRKWCPPQRECHREVAVQSHKLGRPKQCGFSWRRNRGAAPSLIALIAEERDYINHLL